MIEAPRGYSAGFLCVNIIVGKLTRTTRQDAYDQNAIYSEYPVFGTVRTTAYERDRQSKIPYTRRKNVKMTDRLQDNTAPATSSLRLQHGRSSCTLSVGYCSQHLPALAVSVGRGSTTRMRRSYELNRSQAQLCRLIMACRTADVSSLGRVPWLAPGRNSRTVWKPTKTTI